MNLKNYLLNIKKQNKFGFMSFCVAGYPDLEKSTKRMKILLKYCDLLEVGIPFSDPSADGKVIQNASKVAIENGFKTSDVFDSIKVANKDFLKPIVILCYLNTILQYGVGNFLQSCQECGVNALVIPDLPPEEVSILQGNKNHNIELVFIISTNTSIDRVKFIDSISNSFIYFVSKPSITGLNNEKISQETINCINSVREITTNPLYIGFGVSNKKQVKEYRQTKADGFIIGSKIVSINSDNELELFLQEIIK